MRCTKKYCQSELILPVGQEYLMKFKGQYRAFRNYECTKCDAEWSAPTATFTKKEYLAEVEKAKNNKKSNERMS